MPKSLKTCIPLLLIASATYSASLQAAEPEKNYAEALQKSIYFFEAQRSGPLAKEENGFLATDFHNGFLPNRIPWRGDSYLDDGKYNQYGELINIDLTGGWHDAGDHVKFGLPMAFSASIMGWGILEFWDAYEQSGQLPYALDNLRWVSDYFIKAHVSEYEFYAQVGDGEIDHSLWASPETQALELKRIHGEEKYRPAIKLTLDNPGADLVGQTAAALTIASLIFEKNSINNPQDGIYAAELLHHAEQLFDFAYQTKDFTHNGKDPAPGTYTNSMVDATGANYAMSYYNSSSGAKDEIPWAAGWLYLATQKPEYLHKAEENYTLIAENTGHFAWYPAWDDIRNAVYYLMEKVAATPSYAEDTIIADSERHNGYYDYELHSTNYLNELNNKNYTPGGMIYLDGFASARASAMVSMVALIHRNYLIEHSKAADLQDQLASFATQQINYILGDNPHNLSYMVGFGDKWQLAAHHRASHSSTRNDINDPEIPRNILYGALSGGPALDDSYSTDRADFPMTEVATDMNAGLTGALAGLVDIYGGTGLANFPEPVDKSQPEAFVKAKVSYPNGDSRQSGALLNIKMINETAFPPQELTNVSFRYFMDLSDEIANGYDVNNLILSIYYDSFNKNQVALKKWGTEPGKYYIEGTSGTLSPVGDSQKTGAMEIYIGNYVGNGWNAANDPSAIGLNGDTFELAYNITLYNEAGDIVWGTEPDTSVTPTPVVVTPTPIEITPTPILVTPTPVEITPTPVLVTPTPIEITPTPVLVTPTPIEITPTPVLVTPTPIEITPTPVFETISCSVRADVWSNGFVLTVDVTNTGTSNISEWTTLLQFNDSIAITNSWNTTITQTTNSVTAENAAYNGTLKPGQTTSFGMQGSHYESTGFTTPTCVGL